MGKTDGMPEEKLQPAADKLYIKTDELRKYGGQIIPVDAKDFNDFQRQYKQIWSY